VQRVFRTACSPDVPVHEEKGLFTPANARAVAIATKKNKLEKLAPSGSPMGLHAELLL
jgi:hypothetical protein